MNAWILLSPAAPGGEALDTESVAYGVPPLIRHRERMQVTGDQIVEIARVINADPALTDHGLVVREVYPTSSWSNGVETPVAGVAVSVLAANAVRKGALLQNVGLANLRFGIGGVTSITGFRLAPGDTAILRMPFCSTQEWFAVREGVVDSIAFVMELA